MKKILSILLFILVFSTCVTSRNILSYIYKESYHDELIFYNDKWISKEIITIRNTSDKEILFTISGNFSDDYNNGYIQERTLLGYIDKEEKNGILSICPLEVKKFTVYFIGKKTKIERKTSRAPLKEVNIQILNN